MIFGKVISSLLCYFVVIVGFIYVCLYVKYINFFFFFWGYNLVMDFHVDDLCCCCFCYCCDFE